MIKKSFLCVLAFILAVGTSSFAYGETAETSAEEGELSFIDQLEISDQERAQIIEAIEELPEPSIKTYEDYEAAFGESRALNDIISYEDPQGINLLSDAQSYTYVDPKSPDTTYEYTLYDEFVDGKKLVKATIVNIDAKHPEEKQYIFSNVIHESETIKVGMVDLNFKKQQPLTSLETFQSGIEKIIISGVKIDKIGLHTLPLLKEVMVINSDIKMIGFISCFVLFDAAVINSQDPEITISNCFKLQGVNTTEKEYHDGVVLPKVENRFDISSNKVQVHELYNTVGIKSSYQTTRSSSEGPDQAWKDWMLSINPDLTDEELTEIFINGTSNSHISSFVDLDSTQPKSFSSVEPGTVLCERDESGEVLALSYQMDCIPSASGVTFSRKSFGLELPSNVSLENVANETDQSDSDKYKRMAIKSTSSTYGLGIVGFNGLEVIDDATGEKLPYSVKFSYDESTDTLNTDIASNGPTTRAGKITVRYWTFPLDYQHFYESSRIIERGGKYSITLQAYPKINAQWDFRMIAWDALVWRHIGNHVIHTSLGTIALFAVVNPCKDQFLCHVMAAGFLKTPWNLECQRPQVGLAETILAKCNP